MCVICIKNPGIEMPSDETIKKMFKQNPHGAGFAIQGDIDGDEGYKVEYHKGYMTVDEFLKAIHKRNDLKELRVVMHFRIKTSGETDAYTTHPFKMSYRFNDLRKLHGRGAVLFHNGVFEGLGGKADKKSSDTQDFVIGVAMHYLRQAKEPSALSLAIAQEIIGSCKVMILYPNKEYQYAKFGSWTTHTDGCQYSNMNWNYTYSKGTYYYDDYYKRTQSHTENIDFYGCQHYEYQWPNESCDWFNIKSEARMNAILHAATVEKTEQDPILGQYKVCTFQSTGKQKWLLFEDSRDCIKEDKVQMLKDKEELQELYSLYLADPEDEILIFDDEDAALQWTTEAKQTDSFEFDFGKKHWYLDTINLCAYTDEGIKQEFAEGRQGHVKKYLKNSGCTEKYADETSWQRDSKITNKEKKENEDAKALLRAHIETIKETDPAYGVA